MVVERFHQHVFFSALENRPIYASPDMARGGELCALVEHPPLLCWIWASRRGFDGDSADFLFRLWQALIEWLDRLARLLLEEQPEWTGPLHIRLDLGEPDAWKDFHNRAGASPPERPSTSVDRQSQRIEVKIPFGFLTLVRQPTNDGERALLEEVVAALLALKLGSEQDQLRHIAERLVTICLGGPDRRSIHLFQSTRPTDYLTIPSKPYPRLIQPEDMAHRSLGLAWHALSTIEPGAITGVKHCTETQNALVDALWNEIRARLELLNAESLIHLALLNNEALFRDRELWRRTARAVIALHDGTSDVSSVASARENDRALAAIAGRVLIEMAIPTCPRAGGQSVSWSDYDELSAGVATMINLAADSDAVRGGVTTAELKILANGVVMSDHSFRKDVANPYVIDSFAQTYRSAAAAYDNLYEQESRSGGSAGFLQDATFGQAFIEEYGLSPSEIIDGTAELLDLANENGTSAVLRSTRGKVSQRLATNRRFSRERADAFFETLTLPVRERWDKAVPGYANRDWYPWRFRRRLAPSVRPLVVLGKDADSPVLCGMYQLGTSISYLIGGIRDAWFPVEFFRSDGMRRYRGARADALGNEFTFEVGTAFGKLGWSYRTELEMRTLGGNRNLGDLDVICWRAGDDRLLLVECKRLQPARTIAEIVEQLGQFRGESGDRLARHLRRYEWVRQNLSQVRQRLDIPETTRTIVPILVTNAEVPMRYRKGLPIHPEQIIPVHGIVDWCNDQAGSGRV